MVTIMKKQIIMAIGLPFSGKSEAAEAYRAQGFEVIERDALLQDIVNSDTFKKEVAEHTVGLSGKELFAVKNKIAIRLLSEQIREIVRTSSNETFFYDGTNLQKESRAGVLELTKEGVRVDALMFLVPLEEIIRRAEAVDASGERKGAFNDQARKALGHMITLIEEPDPLEGFTEMHVREWQPEVREGQEFGKRL